MLSIDNRQRVEKAKTRVLSDDQSFLDQYKAWLQNPITLTMLAVLELARENDTQRFEAGGSSDLQTRLMAIGARAGAWDSAFNVLTNYPTLVLDEIRKPQEDELISRPTHLDD